MNKSVQKQFDLIKRGCVEIIPEDELVRKLERSIKAKKPLIVKAGFDPSAPDIHLGHTVLLRKLKHFQDLGHEVHFLIGDFTGRMGDPSGKTTARIRMSKEEVLSNAKTYKKQIFKILDAKKTKIDFNSRWCDNMKFEEVINLTSHYTVARMLERDDFAKRYKDNRPISIMEFLYPLVQGWDSVQMKADIELGGTDQKFNLLVGRDLQREYDQEPQVILTMPILEGLDGVEKMSKSLNNTIGITDEAGDMFGKILSISDELMFRYYELLTDLPLGEVKQLQKDIREGLIHPKKAKVNLAKEIVSFYHSAKTAEKAAEEFDRIFKEKKHPTNVPKVKPGIDISQSVGTVPFLASLGLNKSKSELRRLASQGAVKINGKKAGEKDTLVIKAGDVVQIGKREFIQIDI
ncbi:tyrosine--tRNA ligase [PVC group bacterium]|nr:tyrosine--tRNA ligase [PVC group bacterium]